MEQDVKIIRKYRNNRFTLPKAFRDHFAGSGEFNVVITRGQDKCLSLVAKDEFMQSVGKLDSYNNRILVRHYLADALPVQPDSSGRILIPEELLSYAGINNECCFIRRKTPSGVWKYEIRSPGK